MQGTNGRSKLVPVIFLYDIVIAQTTAMKQVKLLKSLYPLCPCEVLQEIRLVILEIPL